MRSDWLIFHEKEMGSKRWFRLMSLLGKFLASKSFLDDFEDLENVTEMVAETLEVLKDQQSKSVTSENNCFANFI